MFMFQKKAYQVLRGNPYVPVVSALMVLISVLSSCKANGFVSFIRKRLYNFMCHTNPLETDAVQLSSKQVLLIKRTVCWVTDSSFMYL